MNMEDKLKTVSTILNSFIAEDYTKQIIVEIANKYNIDKSVDMKNIAIEIILLFVSYQDAIKSAVDIMSTVQDENGVIDVKELNVAIDSFLAELRGAKH